ncbi:MAG: NAD(P)H-hydrate dehydratase [Candidatus Margulisbacteria bacterium]|nr:NAD(P)H-hydrate dehydratase [Candidatus Margulisiibacteriota bacterium]
MVKKKKKVKLLPISKEIVTRLLPKRPKEANKETFGRVLVLAGSKGMTGAAMLCSRAVLRIGAGLSILGIPKSLAHFVDVANPEVMTLSLPETSKGALSTNAFSQVKKVLPRMKAVALGPGLTRFPGTVQLVRKTLKELAKNKNSKIVIDADGLAGLIRFPKYLDLPIITPHTGELASLLQVKRILVEQNPPLYAKKAAQKYKVLVVLKSFQTLVVSPYVEEIFFNHIGNQGMATAGSGDVLTGAIAGFLAQGLDAWSAAIVGIYIHSLAGNIAAIRMGQDGIIASDILESLPLALKRIRGK